jgi:hypothetical protein
MAIENLINSAVFMNFPPNVIIFFQRLTMKHTTKISALTLAVIALLTTQNVLAEGADPSAIAKQEPAGETPKKCDNEEGRGKRLEALKSSLKLTPNQEAAWTEWVDKIKGDRKNWSEMRKNAESLASLPAPERMEKMLAFSKEHIARQEARLAATKTFYATLTPEQRLTFDKGFNFQHGGHFGKHWQQQQQ